MYEITNAIWELDGLTTTETVILVYLTLRAGEKGVCWPSLATISRHTKMSTSGAWKTLRRLREKGLISWERDGYGNNIYRINAAAIMAARVGKNGDYDQVRRGVVPGNRGDYDQGIEGIVPGHNPISTRDEGDYYQVPTNRSLNIPLNTSINTATFPVSTHTFGEPGKPEARRRGEGQVENPETPKTQDTPPSGLNSSAEKTIPAAAAEPGPDSGHRPAVPDRVQAHVPGPRPAGFPYSPERGALVKALRDAGLWERFSGLLRRHARDERAWWAWLDRLAPERQRLDGYFPEAARAALDRLESWPDARYPFAVVERTIREFTPPPPNPSRTPTWPPERPRRRVIGRRS